MVGAWSDYRLYARMDCWNGRPGPRGGHRAAARRRDSRCNSKQHCTLASKSCYPWMDIQDAVDASEDLYGAGADGVHLPGSPYNGAMIRATMEMVMNRLNNCQ